MLQNLQSADFQTVENNKVLHEVNSLKNALSQAPTQCLLGVD